MEIRYDILVFWIVRTIHVIICERENYALEHLHDHMVRIYIKIGIRNIQIPTYFYYNPDRDIFEFMNVSLMPVPGFDRIFNRFGSWGSSSIIC